MSKKLQKKYTKTFKNIFMVFEPKQDKNAYWKRKKFAHWGV